MDMCLLRVNGLVIETVDLRRGCQGRIEILVDDPEFGEFPLTPGCLIEYSDEDGTTWSHITYTELAEILTPLLRALKPTSDSGRLS